MFIAAVETAPRMKPGRCDGVFGGVGDGPGAEEVDLGEVEVGFDAVARVGFVHGEEGGAEVWLDISVSTRSGSMR